VATAEAGRKAIPALISTACFRVSTLSNSIIG
jgi:hypothetical protein